MGLRPSNTRTEPESAAGTSTDQPRPPQPQVTPPAGGSGSIRINNVVPVCPGTRPEEGTPTSATPTGEEDGGGPAEGGGERVVSVEKEGCAAVVVFPERQLAQVVLADGTVVTGDRRGAYEVSRLPPSSLSAGPSRPLDPPTGAPIRRRAAEGGRRRGVHVRAREARPGGQRRSLQDEPRGPRRLRGHRPRREPLPGSSERPPSPVERPDPASACR